MPTSRETLSGKASGQHPVELLDLQLFASRHDVRTYVEVGARYGDTFFSMCSVLEGREGAAAVAVDLPNAAWGRGDSEPLLHVAAATARDAYGVDARVVIGDSTKRETVERAIKCVPPPWDLLFIDGDHSFAGVLADIALWAPHARYVALHDISERAPSGVDVPAVWRALEAIASDAEVSIASSSGMGIGIIHNPRWREAK